MASGHVAQRTDLAAPSPWWERQECEGGPGQRVTARSLSRRGHLDHEAEKNSKLRKPVN